MTETPRRRERINGRQYMSAIQYLVYIYVDRLLPVPCGDSISNPRDGDDSDSQHKYGFNIRSP